MPKHVWSALLLAGAVGGAAAASDQDGELGRDGGHHHALRICGPCRQLSRGMAPPSPTPEGASLAWAFGGAASRPRDTRGQLTAAVATHDGPWCAPVTSLGVRRSFELPLPGRPSLRQVPALAQDMFGGMNNAGLSEQASGPPLALLFAPRLCSTGCSTERWNYEPRARSATMHGRHRRKDGPNICLN